MIHEGGERKKEWGIFSFKQRKLDNRECCTIILSWTYCIQFIFRSKITESEGRMYVLLLIFHLSSYIYTDIVVEVKAGH